jgi:hypothetical protein
MLDAATHRKALLLPFSVVRRKQISDYLGYAMPLHSKFKLKCHRIFQIVGNLFAAFNQRLPFTYASTCKVYLTQMGLPFRTMVRLRGTWLPDHVGTYEVDCGANFLGRRRLAT